MVIELDPILLGLVVLSVAMGIVFTMTRVVGFFVLQTLFMLASIFWLCFFLNFYPSVAFHF